MKRQNNLDHIFLPLSKAIIIIPIVVIIIALFFKASDKMTLTSKQAIPSPTPTVIPVSPTPKINVDLKGTYQCEKTQANAQATLSIKNKKIYSHLTRDNTQEYFLLNGDCLYRWKGYQGEKSCGVDQLMGLYDTMAAFGAVDVGSIMGAVSSSGFVSASDEALLKQVVQTCKKSEVADSIFTVPTNVTFKESDLLKDLGPLMK